MKPQGTGIERLPTVRHSLGYRLREPEGLLRKFVAFLQDEGAAYITRALALRGAASLQVPSLAELQFPHISRGLLERA